MKGSDRAQHPLFMLAVMYALRFVIGYKVKPLLITGAFQGFPFITAHAVIAPHWLVPAILVMMLPAALKQITNVLSGLLRPYRLTISYRFQLGRTYVMRVVRLLRQHAVRFPV